ncbi:ECF subfamily RNA polymerase sigma-24 factor [Novosphingobium nitrogenifigens DSM 19370]|uniref:ECF subfamily RNA polymerase sigma-24 factor n=1 Tax=Novosphingobium nitrogenifigens DSM 19370 TaxID=983920 RepID=F1ZCE2_9SPHN|nr:sigma-70 family RNA polymerase sigma factor [Novosphingobium nitrogenifigens]EGD57776.1 ECF subfamily RNA polymerase sigma-24 factor [Novosphingobium nitrogenifigens DSM 19370]
MTRRWPIPRLAFSRRRPAREEAGHDEDRVHRLILPHLDAAWTYARYLTRDAALAEDIVQDAFLRAFRAQASCHGDGKAWLMAIVRNCWHDWLRAHRRVETAAILTDPVDENTPESLLERQGETDRLRAVLGDLPEPFRETLVLRELEEMSYREIAEVTGAPIGTVMSRLARGREMLAKLMLESEEPDEREAMQR